MNLLERIQATCSAELIASRNEQAIAEALSTGTRLKHTALGVGSILAVMENGGAFLDALEAMGAQNRDIHWVMVLLNNSNLDLGVQKLQDKLTELAAGMPTFAAGINAFKALGYEPVVVSAHEVAIALEGI